MVVRRIVAVTATAVVGGAIVAIGGWRGGGRTTATGACRAWGTGKGGW